MMYLDTSTSTKWLYVSEHGEVPAQGQTTAPTGGGRILRFNLTTGSTTPQVVATRGTGPGQFISPDGITMDTSGNLYVADRFLNRVEVLSISSTTGAGTRVATFGVGAAGATEMRGPLGLARDSAGAIYVGEHGEGNPGTGGNMVSKWILSGGTWTRQWRVPGGGFATPYGVTVSGSELLVADGFNGRIQVLNTSDGAVARTALPVPGVIVLGLSLDGTSVWVAEATGNSGGTQRVVRRSLSDGAALSTVGSAGDGPMQFALPFHAIRDGATNYLYVADYNHNKVQVIDLSGSTSTDTTPPTVASFTAPATATGGVANFTLTFSEAVTGVDVSDFTANLAGGATASIGTPTGSGTTYTVPVTVGGTAGGTVTLTVSGGSARDIRDAAGNLFVGPSTSTAYTIPSSGGGTDTTAPTVASFTAPTGAASGVANFTLTFSEAVTGVDASDFTANVAGGATATIGAPSGSGATYTIPVTVGGTAGGTVTLTVSGGATPNIRDLAGNLFAGPATSTAYTIPSSGGGTPPSLPAGPAITEFALDFSSVRRAPGPLASSATMNLTFDAPVSGVDLADFAVFGPGSITTVTPVGTAPTAQWRVNFNYTDDNAAYLQVGIRTTSTGIVNGSNAFYGRGVTATAGLPIVNTTFIDPPSVASFTAGTPTASSVTFTLTFSAAVSGVDATDFLVARTGTIVPTVNAPTTTNGGTTWSVPVSFTGTGSFQLFLAGGVTTNVRAVASPTLWYNGSGSPVSAVVTVGGSGGTDTTPPTVASFTAPTTATGGVANFTLTFSEAVTGVDASDFTANVAGGATAAIGTPTGSGATYTIPVTVGGTAGGTVTLTVSGGAVRNIQDSAGNLFVGPSTSTAYTIPSSGGTDTTAPTVASFTAPATASGGVANFTLTFSEVVTGVDATDFTATVTGGATATIGAPTGSGTTYTIPVTVGGTAGGTVTLTVSGGALRNIRDAAGNLFVGPSTSSAYTIPSSGGGPDTTAPTVATFTAPATASGGVASFTLVFSEVVTGVDTTDFTATVTGGATATIGAPTGSGTTYTIPVTVGGTAGGTVTLTVSGGATRNIRDAAGNLFVGPSTSTAYTIPSSGGGNNPPPPPPPPVIVKQNQTIVFTSPVSSILVGQSIQLGATSSAGLPITYSVIAGNATISGSSITIHDTKTVVVRATQGGNSQFNAAAPVEVQLTAQKNNQLVTLAAIADALATTSTITLNANSSAGLPITYTVTGPAEIVGNTLRLKGVAGTVTVTASQAGNDAYNPASASRTFNIRAVGSQVFFGKLGSDDFAAGVSGDGAKGMFLARLAATGQAIAAKFKVGANGAFTAETVASIPVASLENGFFVNPTAAAGQTYTVTGTLNNGVLSGTIVELNQSFTANIQPSVGSTASLAGVYTAAVPGSASGDAYIVVGPTGQAYAVATLPSGAISGTGTVSPDGSVNITTNNGGTIAANIEGSELRGSVATANSVSNLVGLSDGADRTDRIVNLSSRLRVTAGDANRQVIAGFFVMGNEPKQVLVRAVGPGLSGFGVSGALSNPSLQIYSGSTLVAENNDWSNNAEVAAAAERVGAFRLNSGSQDAAALVTLAPGAYTAVVQANGGNGIALVEVYDASTGQSLNGEQLVNISTRGFVDTGDGQLIAGFVVTGNAPKRVLVRGIGPGLAQFGLNGVVADPQLKIFDKNNTLVAQNDDWSTPQALTGQIAASAADITAASTATGAFPLAANSRDAAIVITLMPGQYSAVVSGANNGTGAGLVEVYEIPNL